MNRELHIESLAEMQEELKKIKVSSQGVAVMAPKGLGRPYKLTKVKIGAANILKQEMLSLGGDAAVARGIVDGKEEFSDVILFGNLDKYQKLIQKLEYQTIFGLPEISASLQKYLNQHHQKPLANELSCRGKIIDISKPRIMGVVNVTPDSFSDGGNFFAPEKAIEHAKKLIEEGADIIDIGGESSRPGAIPLDTQTEIDRVVPVIKGIRKFSEIPVSIDTCKLEVAKKALSAGADIVNDISALRYEEELIKVLTDYRNVPVVLMHMQGTPQDMQNKPQYADVIDEILNFFEQRMEFCVKTGINPERIILDPGIGFGKTYEHNMLILKKLSELKTLGRPILIGASRKNFINNIYPSNPIDRLFGTVATTVMGVCKGINLFRVHDVKANKEAMLTAMAIHKAEVTY